MSKDFNNIRNKIDQSHKELYDNTNVLDEINRLKKDIKTIDTKIDTMLEILNNFTIMLSEDDQDLEDNYNEFFIPEQEEDWNSYEDDDE